MNFDLGLIAAASPAIKIHMATVIPAFFLGAWLLLASIKGSRPHRAVGVLYLVLMTVAAIDALFIKTLNPGHFSWIHLLVPVTLFGVARTVWCLRRGDIAGHRRSMITLYIAALIIAGGFTFVPGRLMYRIFFG